MNDQDYDGCYAESPSYWGQEPTSIAVRFVQQALPLLNERFSGNSIRIVDIGCGDGRDALYYARQGVYVTGVDISESGLVALRQKAVKAKLVDYIETIKADIAGFKLSQEVHAVVSSGALHHICPEFRSNVLEHYKEQTAYGGIIATTVIVEKPFLDSAPDKNPKASLFQSGEMLQYLWDWEVLWFREEIKPCKSGGVSHSHAFNRIIASKPA